KQRYDRVLGELLMLQGGIITQQQAWVDRMMQERMTFFAQLQDALDRQQDRDANREWLKLKVGLARDGMRTARNLLPALFGPMEGGGGAIESGNGHAPN